MGTNEKWLKFIISGRINDYIDYASSKRADCILGGESDAVYDRCARDTGNEYRGTRPSDNRDDS